MNLKTLGIIPKPRMMALCDFAGYVSPEMVKTRHCVVISPATVNAWGTVVVVPISTKEPRENSRVYVEIPADTYSCMKPGTKVWAKCHLVAHVRHARLDRLLDNGERCLPLVTQDDYDRILDGVRFATSGGS